MKEIAILSGKGGTGKTSVTASLARLAGQPVTAADCDVDAANLALLMGGGVVERGPFVSGERAVVDAELCIGCWACEEVCRFSALRMEEELAVIDPLLCHGCHACSLVCTAEAISFEPNVAGEWMVSETPTGPLVHAELGVAQGNSGKLATEVRKKAKAIAESRGHELVLVDGPPGIGCPVHATLSGVDLVLAVVEPSLSAEHDLLRLAELAGKFRVPLAVVVNKHDLAPEATLRIEARLEELDAAIVGRLPFDRRVPAATARGEPMVSVEPLVEPLRRVLAATLALLAEPATLSA